MTIWLWMGFVLLVLALLALDLGVLNRRPHAISAREALGWTGFWIALALLFNALVYVMYEHHWLGIGQEVGHALTGRQAAIRFLTAYVVEKSLSLDNIFVMAMIFAYFQVPAKYQHRVLFWGVLGALVMRGVMIGVGIAAIKRFDWLVYVFGGFLIITAIKMLVARHDNLEPDKNWVVRLIRRWLPVTNEYHEQKFFVRVDGKLMATPLCLTLALVESSDVIFAVDSIPAVLAVTLDPFIVFTSNVFAILGLRSLYFALAALMERFRYLKMSLVFILAFVGAKMIMTHHYPIPPVYSLVVILGMLFVGVGASMFGLKDTAPLYAPPIAEPEPLPDVGSAYRGAKRVLVLIAGSILLLVGAALLVLPGPGIPIVLAGVALLATEFAWARGWLRALRRKFDQVRGRGSEAGRDGANTPR